MDNDKDTPYQPIACGRYSEYEVAILHHQRLRLAWRDRHGARHLAVVTPEDLQTRDGAEFLIARDSQGDTLRLRLDRITACDTL